jgi:hypothetical protein
MRGRRTREWKEVVAVMVVIMTMTVIIMTVDIMRVRVPMPLVPTLAGALLLAGRSQADQGLLAPGQGPGRQLVGT